MDIFHCERGITCSSSASTKGNFSGFWESDWFRGEPKNSRSLGRLREFGDRACVRISCLILVGRFCKPAQRDGRFAKPAYKKLQFGRLSLTSSVAEPF